MLAAIDIHKAVFQAAVFDPADGAITEERFKASPERLADWLAAWDGKLDAVALEATTGWRWVARALQSRGIEVRLTDAGQASALQGNRKRAKNDRLDARWLVMLLARDMLPGAWMAPEEIQRLRDRTRLRKALTDDPHPLGAAAARDPGPRRVGMLARVAFDRVGSAVGRGDPSASRRSRAGRSDAERDGQSRAADRDDRLRAAPDGQDRRSSEGVAEDLRDRADSRRDRRREAVSSRTSGGSCCGA